MPRSVLKIFLFAIQFAAASITPVSLFASIINVQAFGARGDGHADDTQAIESAIRSCKQRNTVLFPAGRYELGKTVELNSNCNYSGQGHAVLHGYSGEGKGGYPLFQNADTAGGNMIISGLIFDGGGIFFPDTGGSITNVVIRDCTFKNILHTDPNFGPHQSAIFSGGNVLLANSTIDNNAFTNLGGADELKTSGDSMKNGIVLYSIANLTISNNTFDLIAGNGISLPYGSKSPHPGLRITSNKFTRIHRIPIEIQMWYLLQPVISGNIISRPYFPYTFGISFAAGSNAEDDPTNSVGAVIQNNFLDFTRPAAGNNQAWATCIELGGTSTLLEGNTCINGSGTNGGGLWGGAVAIAGMDATVSNNTFCGLWPMGAILYEPPYPDRHGHVASLKNNLLPVSCLSLVAKGARK